MDSLEGNKMNDMQHFSKLIKEAKFAMLNTTSDNRALHSRPMTLLEFEFEGDLLFFTARLSQIYFTPPTLKFFSLNTVQIGSSKAILDHPVKYESLSCGSIPPVLVRSFNEFVRFVCVGDSFLNLCVKF